MDTDTPKEFSVATELQFSMRKIVLDIFYSPSVAWFFLGMAMEALGIVVLPMFGLTAYPIFDFLIGVIIGMFLLWYQKRYPRVEVDNALVDDEDQVAD